MKEVLLQAAMKTMLEYQDAFEELYDFLDKAPFDFKNGNTDPTGTTDEGEVLGYRYLKELLEKFEHLRG